MSRTRALLAALALAALADHAHAQSEAGPSASEAATDAAPAGSGRALSAPGTPPRDLPAPPSAGHGASLGDPADAPATAASPRARGLPVRIAERPLTLPEGTMRFDHAILLRTAGGILGMMAFQLGLGITDDLEIALLWPIQRDPTLTGTYRVYADGTLDVGVRAALQAPIVTEGNTDARLAVPIVVRGGPVRFFAAAELDVLFTANVSTILSLPMQLAVSAGRAFTCGVQGWLGLLDGRHAVGDVQGFLAFTAWAGPRPVLDVRFAAGYAPGEGDVIVNHSVSVYPQLW